MWQRYARATLVGAAIVTMVLSATAAFAGKGIGATFNLGKTNSVDARSSLTENCAGSDVQARRAAQGTYYVRFLNNGSAIAVGNVFEVDSGTNSACSDDYITLDYVVDPMFPTGPRVFRVEPHDDGGGLEDCPFDLSLV